MWQPLQPKDDGGEIIAYLVFLIIVVAVIATIVATIAGIGVIILGGVVLVGLIGGIAVGTKNFIEVLIEAHKKLP